MSRFRGAIHSNIHICRKVDAQSLGTVNTPISPWGYRKPPFSGACPNSGACQNSDALTGMLKYRKTYNKPPGDLFFQPTSRGSYWRGLFEGGLIF